MTASWPAKADYATGDVLSATNMNDLAGVVNFMNPTGTTNGYVLTADSTQTGKVKWAAAGGGGGSGLTLINRTTMSAVSSQTFDSVFSSTYAAYLIIGETIYGSSSAADLFIQMRYGTTTQSSGYYGSITQFGSSTTYGAYGDVAQGTIVPNMYGGGTPANQPGAFSMWMTNVGNSSQVAHWNGTGFDGYSLAATVFGGQVLTPQTYTGFVLTPQSGTLTGTVAIYGLAKS